MAYYRTRIRRKRKIIAISFASDLKIDIFAYF